MKQLYSFLFAILLSVASFASGPADEFMGSDPFLKSFTVYPNPTSGQITLSFETINADQPVQFKVYSLIGQEMYSESILPFSGPQKLEFDLSKYPKGMYVVEISNGKKAKVKRVSVI